MDCLIGIDLGGTSAKAMSLSGERFGREHRISTGPGMESDLLLTQLAALARGAAEGSPISAVGLAMPGLVNPKTGSNSFAGNLTWREVPVRERLETLLQVPVAVINDANAALLGECRYGAAQDCGDVLYVTVGTGIGGGILAGGQLLTGNNGAAGEIGHMVMSPDGPACTCGGRGCLEALASGWAIVREARKLAGSPRGQLIVQAADGDETRINVQSIARAAEAGCREARRILDSSCNWLGLGISNLINILDPELVVIGGGVSLLGDTLMNEVRRNVALNAMPLQRKTVRLVLSQLGDQAGLYGALDLARTALCGGANIW